MRERESRKDHHAIAGFYPGELSPSIENSAKAVIKRNARHRRKRINFFYCLFTFDSS